MRVTAVIVAVALAALLSMPGQAQGPTPTPTPPILGSIMTATPVEAPKHYAYLAAVVVREYFDSSQWSLEGDKR